MGKLTVTLPDEIERKFRDVVKARYGNTRGALSIAVKAAIEKWLGADV